MWILGSRLARLVVLYAWYSSASGKMVGVVPLYYIVATETFTGWAIFLLVNLKGEIARVLQRQSQNSV
jgi:hypothetical protein